MKVKLLNFFIIIMIILEHNILFSTIDNLDTTFGSGTGYATTQNAQGFKINKIRLQANGQIIAVGYTQNPNTQAIITRYNTNGTLDNTFGSNGIVTGTLGSSLSTTIITDAAIQTNGNIVAVGYNYDTSTPTINLIARYTSAGVLDNTFGSGGVLTFTIGSNSNISAVALQSDGKIVVVGSCLINNVPNAFIARLTTSGVLDTTFNSIGYLTVLLGIKTIFNCLTLDASGNIIAAGYYNNSGTSGDQFVMARYTTSGTLDTTFNNPNGFVTGSLGSRTIVNAITQDSSNNILVGGFENNGISDQFFLARYTSSGVLDTTFNNPNGYITKLIGNASSVNDVVVQTGGQIVIAGIINYEIDQATVARYNSNGTIDTTFGNGGVISLNLGLGSSINGIAIQTTDGRVVAGGYEIDPTTKQPFGLVIRYNKNNTDYINITSITNNSTINTKIPTISGTSSAASASVQVFINGVSFGTFSTDGSGNWNAGTSSVLPIGANSIQANLIVSGSTVVSELIEFTVTDNLGEDSVLAYSTSTQTIASANTPVNVSFNNAPLTTTWTNNGTNTFTCHKTGKYQITYNLLGHNTNTLATATISARVVQNGTEISGSQAGSLLTASGFNLISNTVIVNLNAGDTIQAQFAGNATTVQLATTGIGTTLISGKLSIIRLS
jgi:uncharacterized delta-60 repeat protein